MFPSAPLPQLPHKIVAYSSWKLNIYLRRDSQLLCFLLVQDLPALKFAAKMPRYSDQYTLLISKCSAQDHPNSVFHLMPWLSVLKSCIPGLHSSKTSQTRSASAADAHGLKA